MCGGPCVLAPCTRAARPSGSSAGFKRAASGLRPVVGRPPPSRSFAIPIPRHACMPADPKRTDEGGAEVHGHRVAQHDCRQAQQRDHVGRQPCRDEVIHHICARRRARGVQSSRGAQVCGPVAAGRHGPGGWRPRTSRTGGRHCIALHRGPPAKPTSPPNQLLTVPVRGVPVIHDGVAAGLVGVVLEALQGLLVQIGHGDPGHAGRSNAPIPRQGSPACRMWCAGGG